MEKHQLKKNTIPALEETGLTEIDSHRLGLMALARIIARIHIKGIYSATNGSKPER